MSAAADDPRAGLGAAVLGDVRLRAPAGAPWPWSFPRGAVDHLAEDVHVPEVACRFLNDIDEYATDALRRLLFVEIGLRIDAGQGSLRSRQLLVERGDDTGD